MVTMQEYLKKIRENYLPLIQQYGHTYRAVDWGSSQGQIIRFRLLLEVGNLFDASVLDVGCGLGHLAEYLSKINFKGRYLGIDILEEMITSASTYHATRQFEKGNILAPAPHWVSDYVLGSGLFTFGDQELMEHSIRAMFKICKKAVAFNSLSSWADKQDPQEFHADPLAVIQFCKTLTPWVTLRHDYIRHDFTIYMYRKPYC
jgi:SAM-dependent methyltransferase